MMTEKVIAEYEAIRRNGSGFYNRKRGLIQVSGKEAVQFLNGLITNDAAKLEENSQMPAAFPNAQGRLLALVRVLRKDGKFLFETESATHEKIFQNLFRFTFAGDFFVEDLSDNYQYFEAFNFKSEISNPDFLVYQKNVGTSVFVPIDSAENFKSELRKSGAIEISEELYEVLRIENGEPLYGIDMDETTIVPEINLSELVSYNKGCYIGQEIIARIHFRGRVAKKLTGLIFEDTNAKINFKDEIKSLEDKNAGRITSIAFSPKLEKTIALAYVRYDYLAEGTELKVNDFAAKVKDLPFVQ